MFQSLKYYFLLWPPVLQFEEVNSKIVKYLLIWFNSGWHPPSPLCSRPSWLLKTSRRKIPNFFTVILFLAAAKLFEPTLKICCEEQLFICIKRIKIKGEIRKCSTPSKQSNSIHWRSSFAFLSRARDLTFSDSSKLPNLCDHLPSHWIFSELVFKIIWWKIPVVPTE